jgi:hypothetical protein
MTTEVFESAPPDQVDGVMQQVKDGKPLCIIRLRNCPI